MATSFARPFELAALQRDLDPPGVDPAAVFGHGGDRGGDVVGAPSVGSRLVHDRGRTVHLGIRVGRRAPSRVEALAHRDEGRQGLVPAAESEESRHPPRLGVCGARVLELAFDRLRVADRSLVVPGLPALPRPHPVEIDDLEVFGEPVAQAPTPPPDLHRRAEVAQRFVGRRGRVVAGRGEIGVAEAQGHVGRLKPARHTDLQRLGRLGGKGERPGGADRQQAGALPAVAGAGERESAITQRPHLGLGGHDTHVSRPAHGELAGARDQARGTQVGDVGASVGHCGGLGEVPPGEVAAHVRHRRTYQVRRTKGAQDIAAFDVALGQIQSIVGEALGLAQHVLRKGVI